MRHIIIGDIHGCYEELMELLDVVAPTADEGIIAIGDIVDRGPDSEKVLEFFRDTANAMSIIGNHERKHLMSAKGKTRPALSQLIVKAQLSDRYDDWLAFMETFPRHIELDEAILVHGMFEPGVPLEQQRETVVIGTLTGERFMTENYPSPWYDQYAGPKPLIVGHHDYMRSGEPLVREGQVYGIDTGAAHGGRLTALLLPGFEFVSVPSRGDHWTRMRAEFATLAGSSKSDLDLDWAKLTEFAASSHMEALPTPQRERAQRCAMILKESDKLLGLIHDRIKELHISMLSELEQSDDWSALELKQRTSRFAQRAQAHPAAQHLIASYRGFLDRERISKRAKTPRGLARIAETLGIDSDTINGTCDGAS